ncbi:hypothetical protein [Mycoplasma phage MGyu-2021a]|uniref:Uncharacterized protein n=1 Tax=Mycoplasma anserisalpingitidis TaxID=519450 RepID=A0A8F2II06_9MOLU|nr:hypothetical protein [Mycoplasma phage MGyu-2021a]QWS78883.1 hypothetical protein [Mycoplasma anserisalpingitidis]QWT28820.1 hypothetical protein [Mycoplasma anserisalpingitidis]
MIYPNKRRLDLIEWLKKNNNILCEDHLKLQKFLFFYECFTKISGETADFSHLKGDLSGPLFVDVKNYYVKNKKIFNEKGKHLID